MTSVSGCSGGGWTMVMKIDGTSVRLRSDFMMDLVQVRLSKGRNCDVRDRWKKAQKYERKVGRDETGKFASAKFTTRFSYGGKSERKYRLSQKVR